MELTCPEPLGAPCPLPRPASARPQRDAPPVGPRSRGRSRGCMGRWRSVPTCSCLPSPSPDCGGTDEGESGVGRTRLKTKESLRTLGPKQGTIPTPDHIWSRSVHSEHPCIAMSMYMAVTRQHSPQSDTSLADCQVAGASSRGAHRRYVDRHMGHRHDGRRSPSGSCGMRM